jgi:hypothetical protein
MPIRGSVARTINFQLDQRRTDGGHITRLAGKRNDDAAHGRRHLDRRLVGHHVDEVLIFFDAITHRHMPGDDLGFGRAFAHIGQLEDVTSHL